MTIDEVLKRYSSENLPDFFGINISSVETKGHSGDVPLHVACIRDCIADASALLEGGANPNVFGDNGYTPLHYAVSNNNIDIVEILLKHGAQEFRNCFDYLPSDIALERGYNEVYDMLHCVPPTNSPSSLH